MNWVAIGSISELIGAVAVVAAIVYLAAQIQQNSRVVGATIEEASAQFINQKFITMASSETTPLLITKATEDFSVLNEDQQARRLITLGEIFRTFEAVYRRYKTRHISDEIWSGYKAFLKGVLQAYFPYFLADSE